MGIRMLSTDSRPVRRWKLLLWFPLTLVAIVAVAVILLAFILYEVVKCTWAGGLSMLLGNVWSMTQEAWTVSIDMLHTDYDAWTRPTGKKYRGRWQRLYERGEREAAQRARDAYDHRKRETP